MNVVKKNLRRDTRVFISAVTRELGSVRQLVKKALEDNDYHAVEQDNFPPDYRDLIDKLRARIATCDAVIHIAGHCYGAEPPQRPEDAERRSYTQLEYDLARELEVPVYVFLTGAGFPADPYEPEDDERTRLQAAHRRQLAGAGQDYNPVESREQLDQKIRSLQLKVESLQEELTQVDAHVTATGRQLSEQIQHAREQTVKALTDPAALAETIRKQIHATTEEKIKALPDEKGHWRLIAQIEQERDLALGRVDDLIKLIQEGLKEGASRVLQRASEILQKEGTDEALAYLESRRPLTLETARRHAEQAKIAQARAEAEREQRNKTLQALVLEAELLETKLQWQPALQLREQVTEFAPDWFNARTSLGEVLCTIARFRAAEPHLRAAAKLASNGEEEAIAFNNLAQLLQETNHLAEAEPLMRRALAIDEQSHGAAHPDVATDLNNLASLLQDMNRLAEAEVLKRRALAIDEQSYGASHPNVAIRLNNLAKLLQVTNRLTKAEPLMRRALTIAIDFKRQTGHEQPRYREHLKRYADLLQQMQLAEDIIAQRLDDAAATEGRPEAIVPEVERLLGPAQPVDDVLAALDRQYKADGKPAIYFLLPDQPMAPHLDDLLGPSKIDVALDEPIVPHLEKLLGPAPSTEEVFAALDRQYREQGKPAVWFLPLTEPIAPHLDELLGPVQVPKQ